MIQQLVRKIETKKAVIGVVGLGYVGLPLVREFTRGGAKVLGFDVDEKKVKSLMAGRSYIEHIPSRVVRNMVKSGRFAARAISNSSARPTAFLSAYRRR